MDLIARLAFWTKTMLNDDFCLSWSAYALKWLFSQRFLTAEASEIFPHSVRVTSSSLTHVHRPDMCSCAFWHQWCHMLCNISQYTTLIYCICNQAEWVWILSFWFNTSFKSIVEHSTNCTAQGYVEFIPKFVVFDWNFNLCISFYCYSQFGHLKKI